MEITRRFIKFLEELEDPQVQEKYLNHELQEGLRTVTNMLSKFNLNELQKPNSINDLQIFENTLSEGCAQITKRLKETIEAMSSLHVYITNFPLNPFNINRFINAYCQMIFECASITFISPHLQGARPMKIVNGQNILPAEGIAKLAKELDDVMADKVMYALETPPANLEAHIAGKNYLGNIVLKLNKGQDRFYLVMHFTKDSPFTGSFITGKYYAAYPAVLNILTDILSSVVQNVYPSKMDPILNKLEGLKMELIELYKHYFLSYIATEIRTHLDCDVATSIVIDQTEEEIETKLKKEEKKSMQLVLLNGSKLELKNNFQWDNSKLSQKLSEMWAKIKKCTGPKEQGTFYHFYMQNASNLFLEFNNKCELVYQNKPIQQTDLKAFVEVADFLMEPKARSLSEILAPNPQVMEKIQSFIKETEESKAQNVARQDRVPDAGFEFIGKRKEGKKKLEGFAIVFKEEQPPLKKRNSDPIDSLMDDLNNCSESYPTLDPTIKKVKRLLSARHVNPRQLLGEHVDLSALKKTIISEYLPEEYNADDYLKPHKSISSVNKIKLDVTSKTAFTDSPLHKHKSSKTVNTSAFASPKTTSFSIETLISRPADRATLDDWSFDAINIEDPVEKNRLVWAMLEAFDVIKEFNIDLNVLCEFITRMRERYNVNSNAFHNYEHGVTVMHGTCYILRHISSKFTSLVNLGILVSAFCHDASHTGRTNIFEVNSGSKLALKYHDKSVLEQHHAAVTFKVLSKETSNIFSTIKGEDYKQLRKLIISNILATDMKNHFEVMNSFTELRGRIEKIGEESFSWNDEDVTVVSNMIVHCSDLCGPSKTFNVAYYWAQRINEEFSIQVREEEALGIPVTPYFRDLEKPHIMAKQEIAFISFMIKPLWETCNKFFSGAMQIAVDNIEVNVKKWNERLQEALKKKEEEEAAAAAAANQNVDQDADKKESK